MLSSAVSVLLFLLPILVPPQSAEDVLRAAVWSQSPLATLPADSVMVTTGTRLESSLQGQPIAVEYTRVRKGEEMLLEEERVTFRGQTMSTKTRFDGRAGWVSISDGTAERGEEMSPRKVRAQHERNALLALTQLHLILNNKTARLTQLADESINGAVAYVVRVSQSETERSVLYVDQKSLLVVQISVIETDADGTRHVYAQRFSDFRRTANGVIGMKAEGSLDGKVEVTNTIESMELKSATDYPDSMFRKPK